MSSASHYATTADFSLFSESVEGVSTLRARCDTRERRLTFALKQVIRQDRIRTYSENLAACRSRFPLQHLTYGNSMQSSAVSPQDARQLKSPKLMTVWVLAEAESRALRLAEHIQPQPPLHPSSPSQTMGGHRSSSSVKNDDCASLARCRKLYRSKSLVFDDNVICRRPQ